jgi:uncharacterized protein YkwD
MTKPGEHRRPAGRRPPNVLGLASLVGALLAVFGVGAVLLPPSFGASSSSGSAAPAADGLPPGVGAFGSLAPAADRRPARAPAPAPTATTPTKAPKAVPTATPTSKRTRAVTLDRAARSSTSGPQAEVVALVNKERADAGCGAVTANAKLSQAAQAHSQDQADHNTMSHTGSDGSTPWDRSKRAGYDQAIGENVAAGYRTPADVMNGWMNSDGHRANIVNCSAKAIGVGRAPAGNGTLYWTQLFGSL